MNKDVISADLLQFCQEINLVEAISSLHGQLPIPTHQQGQHAIDSIYISPASLHNASGGILSLGVVTPSDHHAVWLDIQAHLVEMVKKIWSSGQCAIS